MSSVKKLCSVQALHSFRLPSAALSLHEVTHAEQLSSIEWHEHCLFLGEGTNTLFVEDFSGDVILNRIRGIEIEETDAGWHLRVGAGENWHAFVMQLLEKGIYGLENLVLIPGSVGAAPIQNIGAYGVEVGEFITQVQYWDFAKQQMYELSNSACQFGYRDSIFKRANARTWFITRVDFTIPKSWQPRTHYGPLQTLGASVSAEAIAARVIEVRNSKLPNPQVLPNAGSFFKNPIVSKTHAEQLLAKYPSMPMYKTEQATRLKLAAGWLIEQCGLKGFCIGDACVHREQALVLVNRGKASGADILALAQHIQQQVREKFGVEITPEVRLIGKAGEQALYA